MAEKKIVVYSRDNRLGLSEVDPIDIGRFGGVEVDYRAPENLRLDYEAGFDVMSVASRVEKYLDEGGVSKEEVAVEVHSNLPRPLVRIIALDEEVHFEIKG